MAKQKGSAIQSPYTNFMNKANPTPSSGAPGHYSKHPNIGPAGVDGGMPLKFTDDSVKGIMPEGPSMSPTPAKMIKS